MPVNNKRKITQVKTLVDLLASGRDLPPDFLESLQAWLIDNDAEEIKDEVLRDYFDDQISSSDNREYALKLWPDLAKKLGMDPEMVQKTFPGAEKKTGEVTSRSANTYYRNPRKSSFRKRLVWYSAAAVVLLAVGLTFILTKLPGTADLPDRSIAMHTINTLSGDTTSVILPDGSKVSMRENTTLSYSEDFTANRRITISGEAFLNVVRDERSPFTVDNKDIKIVVLGTEFNIKDFEDSSNAEVALMTGAVTVTSGDNSVTLNPGEKAVINKIDRNIETAGLTVSETAEIMGTGLQFENVSLNEALSRIGKYFHIDMNVSSGVPQVDGVIMNLDYDATLDDALFLLQATNPVFDYQIQGSTVVISKQ